MPIVKQLALSRNEKHPWGNVFKTIVPLSMDKEVLKADFITGHQSLNRALIEEEVLFGLQNNTVNDTVNDTVTKCSEVLELIKTNPKISRKILAEKTGLSESTVAREI